MFRLKLSLLARTAVLALSLASATAFAEDGATSLTEEAKARLKAASDFLAAQGEFEVQAEVAYDVRQPNGQMIEFGGTRRVSMRRPGHLRIESEARDAELHTLYFDGTTLSLDFPGDGAYVAVKRPGTLYQALDYLVEDLGTPAPLEDVLSENLYGEVAGRITSGAFLGEDRLGGRSCDHLAFRNEHVDAQFWVETGDRPLLCRIIVTHKNELGTPQFRATITDWDLAPKFDKAHFTYAPPKGAAQLAIGVAVEEMRDDAKGDD